MRKSVLALAVAVATASFSSSAATVYENDGTSKEIAGSYEKAVLMSGEAKDFLRYILSPAETPQEYTYAAELSLNVSRVMAEIRRLAGISFPGIAEGGAEK